MSRNKRNLYRKQKDERHEREQARKIDEAEEKLFGWIDGKKDKVPAEAIPKILMSQIRKRGAA